MADQPIKLTPLGNLDKDTEYNFIKEGNYVDALDIIKQDDTGNVSGTTQPTQRNKHAFSLGEVTSSSRKKYRVKAPVDDGQYALSITSTNSGKTIIDYNGPLEYTGVDNFSVQFYSLANFQAEGWTQYPGGQTTNVNIFNVSYPIIDGITYIEFELTAYDYYDYTIESEGPFPLSVFVIQEIIYPELSGKLKDIGSADLLGDLWIFSTTQEVEPSIVDLTISNIGPIVSGEYVGPVTTLSFTSNHNLITGQAIAISASEYTFLNGSFSVNQVISATEIGIVTDTAWGVSELVSSGNIGNEVITINPIGIGEIGVAQKDSASDTWSYIRLLRSTELNFNTLHPMDSFAYKESTKKAIYYTDNYNTPSAFYYKGPYITDGALEFVNNLNTYSYGLINVETSLQVQVKPASIEVLSQNDSGGSLSPGTKYYTVRQKTIDGDETPMSTPFGPVIVYDLDPFDMGSVNQGFSVAATKSETGLVDTTITLRISNLEFGAFPLAELIVIESVGGVITASIVTEFIVPFDGVYEYTHTGGEETTPIGINEVLVAGLRSALTMLKAKSINSVDSRAVLSNITTVSDLDLSRWSKTFTHDLTKDKIPESTLANVGEYQDAKITFDDLGLTMNETYRFSTRVYLRGVGWTPWYWVDDIKVDNNPENTANPDNENRRNSTFDNYELTDNETTSFPNFFGPSQDPNTVNNYQNAYSTLGTIYNDPTFVSSYRVGVDVGLYGWFDDQNIQYAAGSVPGVGFEGSPWAIGNDIIGQSLGGWEDFMQSTQGGRYAVHTNYYVPKISFNINWDFVIPDGSRGNLINEVSAIEFGIGDIPKTILASGLGVVSCELRGPEQPRLKATPQLDYPTEGSNTTGSPLYEFDYHPAAFRPSYVNPIAGTDGYIPYYYQRKYNCIPKYPWAGYAVDTTRPRWQHPVRNVFSFYSADTAIEQSTNGPIAANNMISGATDVLVHGSFGTVKCLPGNPRLSLNANAVLDLENQWTQAPSESGPTWIPKLINSVSAFAEIVSLTWSEGIFSLLHPYGPEYNELTTLKIQDTAFISDSGSGLGDIDGRPYKVWDSAKVQTEGGISGDLFGGVQFAPYASQVDPYVQRGDRAVFKVDGDLSYELDPYYDQATDARKMDRGLHYVQLYKDTSSSYPLIPVTNYKKIGGTIYFDSRPHSTIKINGGDTATSLFYYKNRHQLVLFNTTPQGNTSTSGELTTGSGIAYVSQTRFNIKGLIGDSELYPEGFDGANLISKNVLYPYNFFGPFGLTGRYSSPVSGGDIIVNGQGGNVGDINVEECALAIWFSCSSTARRYIDRTVLDSDYSFLGPVSTSQATTYSNQYLDPELNSKPTRIVWSNKKFPGELLDSYREILPGSYKDLDFSFGQINDHKNINGELFTLQPRKFQLQHFNSRGSLQTDPSSINIVIGEADVLSRDGVTLSSYGTNHKWSVIKGASPGGKDVAYWFNHENGLFMRFGADGTVVLSDRASMRSFSNNNTDWVSDQYSPTKSYGIMGVWDDRFKEAIWTFIGIRETRGEWAVGSEYNVGDIVIGSTINNYPLDNIADLYVCNESHNSTEGGEPGSSAFWTAVAKDDPEYYSVFTLAFNELSNGFSTFYSHLPKTYMKWSNKFLSSNPLHRSEMYEHRYGYDKWYEYNGVWKESEPFVEGVVNYIPEQSKKFVAIQSLSENVPDKIEFKTKEQESFLVAADFDPEDDAWRSPIKNDILTSSTSDPNDDTVSLLGSYMRVKFKFFNGAYNKMNNMIIKVRARLRRTSS